MLILLITLVVLVWGGSAVAAAHYIGKAIRLRDANGRFGRILPFKKRD